MTGAHIADKVAYVRSSGQTRDHHCHWPGCDAQVPPAAWGCHPHWFKLPKPLRNRIWAAFDPGQEVDGTPSAGYIAAARDVQAWIAANHPPASEAPQQALLVDLQPTRAPRFTIVTLIDGRQVQSDSEEWRHECEARYVANLPSQQSRREYLDPLVPRHGPEAAKALEDLAVFIYDLKRKGPRP